ncbi:MAG TPA: hypothetical protein VM493_01825 [Vicinamibacterales bacterium]|nr:hypothetical protein [Vicinamibacterales bacterium]
MLHLPMDQIRSGLEGIRAAPRDAGRLEMIVRRPAVNARELLETASLDVVQGLVGDTWQDRASSRTPDGSPHPDMQLTLIGVRTIGLLAGERERWPLAGDQLFVDLDLSATNLPAGTRLSVGTAVIEVTAQPHTGCGKFVERFGVDAMKFVNSPEGRALNLRGINAKVVEGGVVRVGDSVRKIQNGD